MIYNLIFSSRFLGCTQWGRTSSSRTQLHPTSTLLGEFSSCDKDVSNSYCLKVSSYDKDVANILFKGLCSECVVRQIPTEGTQTASPHWSPLSGSIPGPGPVLQHGGLLKGLQLPNWVQHESAKREQMPGKHPCFLEVSTKSCRCGDPVMPQKTALPIRKESVQS